MDERAIAALRLLKDNPRTRLKDLAAAICISPSRLQHIFALEHKTSIRSVSREEILSRAARLVAETGLSIKEVRAHVGFADASAFCRAFKRYHGVSPSDYRRRTRMGQESVHL